MRFTHRTVAIALAVLSSGCQLQRLTASEARDALEETQIAQQAAALTSASVEVTTDFTIGSAVESAAGEIRSFVANQLPCAEIAVERATITIGYGKRSGDCRFNGHTFAGTHSVEVARNEMGDVLVQHTWDGFNNGVLRLDGTADVTWDAADRERRIDHELTWTRLRDGRMGVGSGARVQEPLAGGLIEGIRVDGTRAWEGDAGHWELDIEGIQMRWVDPVPQAGRYQLETPFDKTVGLVFTRVDEDTIAVTVEGPRRSFSYNVNALGQISASE
ncbi:MAG: hypothetical protein OXU20_28660 [Myxococcales bacterium]|nr:hypothetical protein [Myxococcales bacterium]MDD9966206.1 hypothetical protein [Myxococcales bacterium]